MDSHSDVYTRQAALGWKGVGMGKGRSVERMEANASALRGLVDSRSPRIVRDPVVGESTRARRIGCPCIGDRSGKLTVTGYLVGKSRGLTALLVKCDCGFPEYTVEANNFKSFKSTRCNQCALKSSANTRKLYWGYSEIVPNDEHRERLLNRFSAALNRCRKPTDAAYHNYGGRGICVHPEWAANRAEFLRHVITLDGWDNPELEMDREDCDGNYEPGNIRFVSRRVNMGNKRKVSVLQQRIEKLEKELASLRRS